MLDNLDDETKEHLKKEDNKRKEKRDNFHDNEKEQLRKHDKKERKLCVIASEMMRKNKLEKMTGKERWINVYKL